MNKKSAQDPNGQFKAIGASFSQKQYQNRYRIANDDCQPNATTQQPASCGMKNRPRTSMLMKPRTVSSVLDGNLQELVGSGFTVRNNFRQSRQKSASGSSYRKYSIDKRSTENSTHLPLQSIDGKKIQLVPIPLALNKRLDRVRISRAQATKDR